MSTVPCQDSVLPETLGAVPAADGACRFRVWAPRSTRVAIRILGDGVHELAPGAGGRGYHEGVLPAGPGDRYLVVLDGGLERPDPASRSQPEGVHGPSEIADPGFGWTDADWCNPALDEYVIYELHVGVFTGPGTFAAAIDRLDDLAAIGVTALELMPVAQFPGARNWGYDGVGLFAAQDTYGGPAGLKTLVDACHARGLAVLLDVVYNHLGPEGNYLADFGPYFTDRYRTPWGAALNFDGPGADEVRAFFIANALYWLVDCHVDGLRLDAVHAIADNSALPFVEELAAAVHRAAERHGRRMHVIAESAANDARLVRAGDRGGVGLDAAWNDDFHHALHALLTGERRGYYEDFGRLDQLARAWREGFAYQGEYSPHFRRRHGRPSADIPAGRFVVFDQNHDQVGNRLRGDRLAAAAGIDGARLGLAVVLLSPFIPLLFMGEEYAEPAPFLYFISHGDPGLAEAVREGRRREFESFGWAEEPADPQDPRSFERSRLDWSLRDRDPHARMLDYVTHLLTQRRDVPALRTGAEERRAAEVQGPALVVRRRLGASAAFGVFNFSPDTEYVDVKLEAGPWRRLVDSADPAWGGPGLTTPPALAGGAAERLAVAGRAAVAYASGMTR